MSRKKELRREAQEIGNFVKLALKVILLFSIFLMSITLFFGIYRAVGAPSDIEYTWNDDIFYEGDFSDLPNNTINVRNRKNYTVIATYNASYSFSDDTNGVAPSGWADTSGGSCSALVVENENLFSKVVDVYDADGSQAAITRTFSSAQENGTVEFWIKTCAVNTDQLWVVITGTGGYVIHLRFENGNLEYRDSGGSYNTIITYTVNTWYHIRLDFECDGDGYMGLSADHFYIYINNVRYGEYTFRHACTDALSLFFYSNAGDSGYHYYFDAVGFSWDNYYTIDENKYPMSVPLSEEEVDKFEFAYDIDGSLYPQGTDNPNGWTDIEDGGDEVNVVWDIGQQDPNDRRIMILQTSDGALGITKDFDSKDGICNLTIMMQSLAFLNTDGYFRIYVESDDSTEIVRVEIKYDGANVKLYYWDGASNVELYTFTMANLEDHHTMKHFELMISTMVTLNYRFSSTVNEIFIFPLLDITKKGFDTISFIADMPDSSHTDLFTIDNVGVYLNGSSEAIGFSNIEYNMSSISPTWYFNRHNLITLNASGNFSIRATTTLGFGIDIFDYSEFNDNDRFVNIYNETNSGTDSGLYLTFNSSFTINSMVIRGVALTEGVNNYYMDFDYSNVNISRSYFYVDNSTHRLLWFLVANDNDTENIIATFDINNVWTTNRSFQMTCFKNTSLVNSFFRLSYTDTSYNLFDFEMYPRSFNNILAQGYIIDTFRIYIGDGDEWDSNTHSGYISSITLNYLPDISYTISTLSFMGVIVPIIVLFAPSLVVGGSIKKGRFSKIGFLGMLMLMSVVCMVTNIIPVWIFIILAIAIGAIIFISEREMI